jgi:hypothetical protein
MPCPAPYGIVEHWLFHLFDPWETSFDVLCKCISKSGRVMRAAPAAPASVLSITFYGAWGGSDWIPRRPTIYCKHSRLLLATLSHFQAPMSSHGVSCRRGGDVVPAAAPALRVGSGPGHARQGGAARHHPTSATVGMRPACWYWWSIPKLTMAFTN